MSIAFRRIARASVLALVIGFAPAASAIGQSGAIVGPEQDTAPSLPPMSREEAEAATAAIAPTAVTAAVAEALHVRAEADEDDRAARSIAAEADKIRPGKYVWRPDRAQSGTVEMVVSLKAQRIYVFRNRKLIAVSSVSSGRPGNVTPTGAFPILQRRRTHFSNLYNNAPMPNMQRLTWDGVALHAGVIPAGPASHGCVRLPTEFSRLLFGISSIGTVVHVVQDEPETPQTALRSALRQVAVREATGVERILRRAERRREQPRRRG